MSAEADFPALFPAFSALEGSLAYRTFGPGEFITREAEELTRLYFLLSGTTRVYRTLYNGKTHLFQIYRRGEIIGDIEFFLATPTACAVEAGTPVETVSIPFPAIEKRSPAGSRMIEALGAGLARKLHRESRLAALNASYSLRTRLAAYLLAEETAGIPRGNMADAAHMLGTSDRHLRRVLREMVDDGIVRRSRDGYRVVDREGLLKLCDELLSP